MSVACVYSSGTNGPAHVLGYLHDDGTTAVLMSPVLEHAPGLTLNIHWTPAEARRVAAMLVAAADATEIEACNANDVENAREGLAAMERAK